MKIINFLTIFRYKFTFLFVPGTTNKNKISDMQKFEDEDLAITAAKDASLKDDETYYVVLSKGFYYVDTESFIRNWETLIATFINGKQIKD